MTGPLKGSDSAIEGVSVSNDKLVDGAEEGKARNLELNKPMEEVTEAQKIPETRQSERLQSHYRDQIEHTSKKGT